MINNDNYDMLRIIFFQMQIVLAGMGWGVIDGYLTLHEAYCLDVGYHCQVMIYTH